MLRIDQLNVNTNRCHLDTNDTYIFMSETSSSTYSPQFCYYLPVKYWHVAVLSRMVDKKSNGYVAWRAM